MVMDKKQIELFIRLSINKENTEYLIGNMITKQNNSQQNK